MNHIINNFTPNLFPTYWKEKKGTTVIIRISAEQGIMIPGNNRFQNQIKTHFGNRTLFEGRLTSFKEIPEEEFNSSKLYY